MIPEITDLLAYRLALANQSMLKKVGTEVPFGQLYEQAIWLLEKPTDRAFYAKNLGISESAAAQS